ncbi:MAG: hypothetical protein WC455_28145 [Dehalococcoidia bacterium]
MQSSRSLCAGGVSVCPSALPVQPGDICEKCGANDDELMTEEEWDEAQK